MKRSLGITLLVAPSVMTVAVMIPKEPLVAWVFWLYLILSLACAFTGAFVISKS